MARLKPAALGKMAGLRGLAKIYSGMQPMIKTGNGQTMVSGQKLADQGGMVPGTRLGPGVCGCSEEGTGLGGISLCLADQTQVVERTSLRAGLQPEALGAGQIPLIPGQGGLFIGLTSLPIGWGWFSQLFGGLG